MCVVCVMCVAAAVVVVSAGRWLLLLRQMLGDAAPVAHHPVRQARPPRSTRMTRPPLPTLDPTQAALCSPTRSRTSTPPPPSPHTHNATVAKAASGTGHQDPPQEEEGREGGRRDPATGDDHAISPASAKARRPPEGTPTTGGRGRPHAPRTRTQPEGLM